MCELNEIVCFFQARSRHTDRMLRKENFELRLGAWCSGITCASQAQGPGFNPRRVHTFCSFSGVHRRAEHARDDVLVRSSHNRNTITTSQIRMELQCWQKNSTQSKQVATFTTSQQPAKH